MNKKLISFALALFITVAGTTVDDNLKTDYIVNAQFSDDSFTGTITGIGVKAPTQEQIAGFYRNKNIATALSYHTTYSVQPDFTNHISGVLDTTTVNHALNTLNYVRYIAGLGYNVVNNTTYAQQTQDGCYLNNFNGYMSHYPGVAGTNSTNYLSGTAVYSSGKIGAENSNVGHAGGSYISSDVNFNKYPELLTVSQFIIDGWMEDGDSDNISNVGHRRWCLYPKMTASGFGQITLQSAPYFENGKTHCSTETHASMYVVDTSGSDVIGVAWPAQNTPLNTFGQTYPWSYSYGKQFSGVVTVALTNLDSGKVYNFNSSASGSMTSSNYISVDNSTAAYGQVGCVIFDPNISYAHGDTFWVEIKDGSSVIASYPVSFFDVGSVSATSSIESPSSTGASFTYNRNSGVSTVSNNAVPVVEEVVEIVVEQVVPEIVVPEVIQEIVQEVVQEVTPTVANTVNGVERLKFMVELRLKNLPNF